MNESLEDRIKRHEGFCFKPKYDAKGMYVIGHGHDLSEDDAQVYCNGISQDEADELLYADIAKAKHLLAKELPWTEDLPQLKREILTEMVFQMGINGLLKFHNLLFHARSGDEDGVVHSMLSSLWHKQTPDRCEELANLWFST